MFYRGKSLSRTSAVLLLLVALGAFTPACRSGSDGKPRIVFIAPPANLSADPALEWFGRAIAGLIVARTTGSTGVQTIQSTDANATHRLEGYFSEAGGVLSIHTALRDLSTQKVVDTVALRGPASDLLRITDTLARDIGSTPQPYTTSNSEAVRHLFVAANSASVDDALTEINAAISADPAYGSAQVARVETLVAANRREEASSALEAASGAGVKLNDEDKLRLANARATLSGDLSERTRATLGLARLRRADLELWRTAAELSLIVKDFPTAIDALNNATKLEPSNIVLWNMLGYAHAYAGDLGSARRALEEYQRLAPDDANAFDSLGEVYYYLGRFEDAERYFLEAFSKNKALLGGGDALRAGMARLMMGDRETADKHFATYIDLRKQAGDVLVPVRQALWQFWTGRRKEAIAALQSISAPPDAATAARTLLSLWHVQFGEAELARKVAAEAAQTAKTQQAASWALIARILATPAPPMGAEPQAITSITDPMRRRLLGYTFLLHRNYVDAERMWSVIYDSTSASTANDERVLLAWAESERNNVPAVSKLMRAYALHPAGADPGPESSLFPRSIYLKAAAEQHMNNRAEAQRLFKLFLQYSAGRDFVYGEEQRARDAIQQTN